MLKYGSIYYIVLFISLSCTHDDKEVICSINKKSIILKNHPCSKYITASNDTSYLKMCGADLITYTCHDLYSISNQGVLSGAIVDICKNGKKERIIDINNEYVYSIYYLDSNKAIINCVNHDDTSSIVVNKNMITHSTVKLNYWYNDTARLESGKLYRDLFIWFSNSIADIIWVNILGIPKNNEDSNVVYLLYKKIINKNDTIHTLYPDTFNRYHYFISFKEIAVIDNRYYTGMFSDVMVSKYKKGLCALQDFGEEFPDTLKKYRLCSGK